jgi:hypothetical protein
MWMVGNEQAGEDPFDEAAMYKSRRPRQRHHTDVIRTRHQAQLDTVLKDNTAAVCRVSERKRLGTTCGKAKQHIPDTLTCKCSVCRRISDKHHLKAQAESKRVDATMVGSMCFMKVPSTA